MQTITKKEYKEEVLKFQNGLLNEDYEFKIYGQTVDRSYEDRDVYFEISKNHGWLRAEEAIELGTKLIEHGKNAMLSNMYNHQKIHCMNRLEKEISENKIKKIILEKIDDKAPNHGGGFVIYKIIPMYKNEETLFEFELVLYEGLDTTTNDISKLRKRWNIEIDIIDKSIQDKIKENENTINDIYDWIRNNKISKYIISDCGLSDIIYNDCKHNLYNLCLDIEGDKKEFSISLTEEEYKMLIWKLRFL